MRYATPAPIRRELWVSLTQCAWCNRIRLGRWYLPYNQKIIRQWALRLPMGLSVVMSSTHGVCPECAEQVYRRARSERSERAKALLKDPGL